MKLNHEIIHSYIISIQDLGYSIQKSLLTRKHCPGMTVPEGSARELPLGEDWVEPIALFFQCKGVLWQDMARDGNQIVLVETNFECCNA